MPQQRGQSKNNHLAMVVVELQFSIFIGLTHEHRNGL
jgi:hypothetical protein